MTAACPGVAQVLSTANNVMNSGAFSPVRVDVPAYRALCESMRQQGVQRMVHVSALDLSAGDPVYHFGIQHQVNTLIEAGGVLFVVVQP